MSRKLIDRRKTDSKEECCAIGVSIDHTEDANNAHLCDLISMGRIIRGFRKTWLRGIKKSK